MKRLHLLLFVAISLPFAVNAEQITKVAVIDYARILEAFYTDSLEARKIESMKKAFAEEVKKLQEEIQLLEEQKLEAETNGKSSELLDISDTILARKQYYQEFVRIRGNQIRQAAASLSSSNALAHEILREIQYVAESNGFSVVLKRSDPNLLWWSYETDITDMVLKRLMRAE